MSMPRISLRHFASGSTNRGQLFSCSLRNTSALATLKTGVVQRKMKITETQYLGVEDVAKSNLKFVKEPEGEKSRVVDNLKGKKEVLSLEDSLLTLRSGSL